MSDRPEWFQPKSFGFGSGLPIAWQGWVLTVLFIAATTATAILLGDVPVASLSIIAMLTALFLLIVARTTKGGWRWRWGEKK